MAYRDPTLLRANVVKVRLSSEEDRLLEALCDYTGEQKAVLVRELVMARAREVLEEQFCRAPQGVEVPCGALARA